MPWIGLVALLVVCLLFAAGFCARFDRSSDERQRAMDLRRAEGK
jgi:hypothetical protein